MKIPNLNSNKLKTRKIWVVSQFYPPDFAATGQLLEQLVNGLLKKGLIINVLTSMPSYAFSSKTALLKEKKINLEIKRTRNFNFFQKNFIWKIFNGLLFCAKSIFEILIKSKKIDKIIYTTEPAFLPLFANFAYRFNKKSFIIINYDLYPDIITKLNLLSYKNFIIRIWKFLLNQSYKKASKIIVLSEPMKETVLKSFPSTFNKLEVISSWADHEHIKEIKKEDNWFIKKNNLSNKFVVLYSGNQGRCHDLSTIIKSANNLKMYSSIIFLFIGDGEQNNKIKSLVKLFKLDNCIFLPYQKYEDLSFSLGAADIAVVSITKEASSLVAPSKLYGHLAAGTPIAGICPNYSYLYKLIKKNKIGEAFENGDFNNLSKWILSLYENKELKNDYTKISRNFLMKHANKNDILDTYFSILIS